MKKFIVVNAGKDDVEQLFQKLVTQPESFSGEEFAQLADETFRDRLSTTDKIMLIEARLHRCMDNRLERDALLAIIRRQHGEYERLMEILKHRNALRSVSGNGNANNDSSPDIQGGESNI